MSFQIKDKNYSTTLDSGAIFLVATDPSNTNVAKKFAWNDLSGYFTRLPPVLIAGYYTTDFVTPFTPNANLGNVIDINALTGSVTMNAPTGTVTNGQLLQFRFQYNNTGYLTWNSSYAFGTDITTGMLPTASGSKFEIGSRYHSGDSKWRIIGLTRGF